MNKLSDITAIRVTDTLTVYSKQGRHDVMTNRKTYGISFCTSGKITYRMNGENYVSDANHAVILPKGQSYTIYGNETGYFPVINFECTDDSKINDFIVVPCDNTEKYLIAFSRLSKSVMFENNNIKQLHALYEILDMLQGESGGQNILFPAVQYINKNFYDSEIKNTDLAKSIGISEVYLRKLFKKHYGTTPKQYIIDIRLKNAKHMLCSTDDSVTAISDSCGFSSVYHFCRAFRNAYGTSPTQYRKNMM